MPTEFKPGDRVKALSWGKEKRGTVNSVGPRSKDIVFVMWDGAKSLTWQFADSLTLINGKE